MNQMVKQKQQNAMDAFGGFEVLANAVIASDAAAQEELRVEGRSGDISYVNFAKFGYQGDLSPWTFGLDDHEIHPESEWIVDPTTFQHGWMGFKPGKDGKPVKGQQPDKIFSPWNTAFPDRPHDMPWANNRAFMFRAICRDSPIAEHIGVYVEVTDWRKMKAGFGELELALRERVKQAMAAKQSGNTEVFERLRREFYPVIRFKFELGVQTSYGLHNKGIIEHIGWSAPVIFQGDDTVEAGSDADAEPEDDGAPLDEKVAAVQESVAPRRRGRRRD